MTGKTMLRVAYVGMTMDLALAAYREAHRRRGHELEYYRNPDHIPRAPAPDVVVIAPMVPRNGRVEGPCYVNRLVPPTTLIVAVGTAEGHSHAMWVKHALEGRCHPRILIHYPSPGFGAPDFVDQIGQAACRPGPISRTMWGLPKTLQLPGASRDLGQIMDDPALTMFLHTAATNSEWSTWQDLAQELNMVAGTVKNRMSMFGRHATEAGLLPANGEHRKFRIGQFVRYITEHRSFIRAYLQHHREAADETRSA